MRITEMVELVKNILFRIAYGFQGYPKQIYNSRFRIDESLRRFDNGGEDEIQKIIESYLGAGDTFVDVGANFGLHTLLGAQMVGADGTIVAIEPVPFNFRLLQRNLKLNGFTSRCEVFPVALTAIGGGEVEMTVEPGFSPAASLRESSNGEKISVPTNTLDACLANQSEKPALIKIDVEGAEHEVLKGAEKTLAQGPPILVEVHSFALPSFDSSPEALSEYLASFGYVEKILTEMKSKQGNYFHALYTVQ